MEDDSEFDDIFIQERGDDIDDIFLNITQIKNDIFPEKSTPFSEIPSEAGEKKKNIEESKAMKTVAKIIRTCCWIENSNQITF